MVKDPVLSLLWHEFDPWPGNFCMPRGIAKRKKKKEKRLFFQIQLNCEYWVLGFQHMNLRGSQLSLEWPLAVFGNVVFLWLVTRAPDSLCFFL